MLEYETNTIHLVTCGTSILSNFKRMNDGTTRKIDLTSMTFDEKVSELIKFVKKEPKKMSAELNSILSFGIKDISKIYLLATDTEDGELCATVIKKYFNSIHEEESIESEVVKIDGFGTEKFENGLINLRNEVVRIIKSHLGKN
ncbi:MAG: putative CRISPR-associated protein, partial [Promethearchaeota archaeon]